MHLIINLVFLTSFQFMNLSNLALWVNNRRKWITIIFLNLCDNFPYYMICFFLLSLVFAFIYLFVFVLSQYFHISDNDTIPLKFLLHYWQKLSFTLLFFFFLTCPYYWPDKHYSTDYTNIFSNLYQLYSLYLSLLPI